MADKTFLALGSELSDVSTAIRAKAGGTGKLLFPDGMCGAVNGIPKKAATAHQSFIGGSEKIIVPAGTYIAGAQTLKPMAVKSRTIVFRTPNIVRHPDSGKYGEYDFVYLESDQYADFSKITRILGLRDFKIKNFPEYLDTAALKSMGTLNVSNHTISGGIKLLLGSKYTGASSYVLVEATIDFFE